MKGDTVIVDRARNEEQRKVLEEINKSGECPFCIENLAKRHQLPITLSNDHWIVTENQWPYENAGKHVLIISVRHVETLLHLTHEEWASWTEILIEACQFYNIDSGAICMRFGDPLLSGASVRHLHAQLIVPKTNAKGPVRFTIGK